MGMKDSCEGTHALCLDHGFVKEWKRTGKVKHEYSILTSSFPFPPLTSAKVHI